MQKVLAGLVLAIAAAAALLVGDGLGWDLDGVLYLGAGVGGALGLIPDRTPLARVGGLLIGVLAAAVGYVVRAALLPDNTTARAVSLLIVIAIATGLVLLTFGRVPLWSALLGIGALGGAYEVAFTDSPGSVLSTLPVALSSLLVMAAVGFAATVFVAERKGADPADELSGRHRSSDSGGYAAEPDETASLDEVLAGQGGR